MGRPAASGTSGMVDSLGWPRVQARGWTFLTHHARVLIEIAGNPSIRLRDIADRIGITERSTQGIVSDLEEGGYITRTRVGRRNHYTIDASRPFRYPTEADHRIEGLLSLFAAHDQNEQRTSGPDHAQG